MILRLHTGIYHQNKQNIVFIKPTHINDVYGSTLRIASFVYYQEYLCKYNTVELGIYLKKIGNFWYEFIDIEDIGGDRKYYADDRVTEKTIGSLDSFSIKLFPSINFSGYY